MEQNKKPEILAPAGNFAMLERAVAFGADAVYLGLKSFNARGKVGNFDPQELSEAIKLCRFFGVRLYVALNTMIFERDLEAVRAIVQRLAEAGVDGVIAADIGVVSLLNEFAPNLPIHISTQAGVSTAFAARFFRKLGADRVVLARETLLEDIKSISENSKNNEILARETLLEDIKSIPENGKNNDILAREILLEDIKSISEAGLETEVFAHGALCVCFSGACLLSADIERGASGNLGSCLQLCRLPYTVRLGSVEKRGYFLSTADLCMISKIKKLCEAGVSALKIEGRARRKEYAAEAVLAYRHAVDADTEGNNFNKNKGKKGANIEFSNTNSRLKSACNGGDNDVNFECDKTLSRLKRAYNRGDFTQGYAFENGAENIMFPHVQSHTGERVGRVLRVFKRSGYAFAEVESFHEIVKGDGFKITRDGLEVGGSDVTGVEKVALDANLQSVNNPKNSRENADKRCFETAVTDGIANKYVPQGVNNPQNSYKNSRENAPKDGNKSGVETKLFSEKAAEKVVSADRYIIPVSAGVRAEDELNLTTDAARNGDLNAYERKTAVKFSLTARTGFPIALTVEADGFSAYAESEYLPQKAVSAPSDSQYVIGCLSRTGNSRFEPVAFETVADNDIFIPKQSLNELRRRVTAELEENIINGRHPVERKNRPLYAAHNLAALQSEPPVNTPNTDQNSPVHREKTFENGTVITVYKPKMYAAEDIAEFAKRAYACGKTRVFLAFPRILCGKDFVRLSEIFSDLKATVGNYADLKTPVGIYAESAGAVEFAPKNGIPSIGIYAENAGAVEFARENCLPYVAGRGLNIANSRAASMFGDAFAVLSGAEVSPADTELLNEGARRLNAVNIADMSVKTDFYDGLNAFEIDFAPKIKVANDSDKAAHDIGAKDKTIYATDGKSKVTHATYDKDKASSTVLYGRDKTVRDIDGKAASRLFAEGVPLMSLAHCPYQLLSGKTCQNCEYRDEPIIYENGKNVYEAKRMRLTRCIFELYRKR
ncbi:MAG: U32 family peptidase [Clostridiaceae bacterium]|nr:U32 family peptidase [Clostridiaceae bacterium]